MEYRFAQREDVGLILDFIRRLAEFEMMSEEVTADNTAGADL